jgi:cell division septum initiation protein DivIVA
MATERSDLTGETIRNVELSRTYFGGVDEASTRELLGKLAETVDEARGERDRIAEERELLAQRVRELEAALDERAPEAPPKGYTEEALSDVIRTAKERFDAVLSEANEEAERVRAAASAEAAQLRAAAAADTESLLAGARAELEATQRKTVELQQLLVNTSNQLFETLQTALAAVEALELAVPRGSQAEQLVEDLWPNAVGGADESGATETPAPDEQSTESSAASST